MRSIFLALIAALSVAAPAKGDTALRSLVTADDTKGWEAVGRLNIAGQAFCTGALIRDDLVLTAAHCLYDKDTGQRVDATTIEFLAGWRNGRASAYRGVRQAVVHPDYVFSNGEGAQKVKNDLAVLRLDQPIRTTGIQPFETDTRPRKGAEVGVVSYAHDRAEMPSIQEACHVLARQSGTLILSCDVDFGSSGAPIFSFEGGVPRIVSVVSAKARVNARPVSLGTELDRPLGELMAALEAEGGRFAKAATPAKVLSLGAARAGTGAKFLKPGG